MPSNRCINTRVSFCVEARMFKKLCESGFELEESVGIVKFATEEMRYNTDLYYEIAGLSLLKNVQKGLTRY